MNPKCILPDWEVVIFISFDAGGCGGGGGRGLVVMGTLDVRALMTADFVVVTTATGGVGSSSTSLRIGSPHSV